MSAGFVGGGGTWMIEVILGERTKRALGRQVGGLESERS